MAPGGVRLVGAPAEGWRGMAPGLVRPATAAAPAAPTAAAAAATGRAPCPGSAGAAEATRTRDGTCWRWFAALCSMTSERTAPCTGMSREARTMVGLPLASTPCVICGVRGASRGSPGLPCALPPSRNANSPPAEPVKAVASSTSSDSEPRRRFGPHTSERMLGAMAGVSSGRGSMRIFGRSRPKGLAPKANERSRRSAARSARARAVGAPNTTATWRRPSRVALPTRLKPEAQIKPVFIPSAPA